MIFPEHDITLDRFDTPHGSWLQAGWSPAWLAETVERIWYFEGRVAERRERVFPTGHPELVVHLGPSYQRVTNREVETFAPVCVNGVMSNPDIIDAPEAPAAVLGIRFRATGAYSIFPSPAEITNITVDVADLIGRDSEELAERCAEAASPVERIIVAADWVKERALSGPQPDAAVRWSVSQIEGTYGTAVVADLIKRTGWSKSRFADRFKREVGVSPKLYARIVRFRRAMDLLRNDSPLIDAALEAGFYDQPHFNADFRRFAGMTPGAFRMAQRYPNSANLIEQV